MLNWILVAWLRWGLKWGFIFLISAVIIWVCYFVTEVCYFKPRRKPITKDDPHWEAVRDPESNGIGFWRVRWSKPDEEGRYWWTRHYSFEDEQEERRARHFAERQAKQMNDEGKHPMDLTSFMR